MNAGDGYATAGRRVHVRVDSGGGKLPAADAVEDRPDFVARSVTLASETLGIIAKIDLVEGEDGTVTPVDTKKGKRPHVAEGAYEPERVQVCAQALILEDAGYKVAKGAIWYAGSRERVRIALDQDLRAKTRAAIAELRFASPPRAADCRRRSTTAPKCTSARSPVSVCPTKWRSSAVDSRRVRSIPPPTWRSRSMSKNPAHG